MITLAKVKKFISIRNKSEFDTNFAFMSDADLAGFNYDELGKANHLPHAPKIEDRYWSFYWDLPFGILVEHWGKLRLFKRVKK